MVLEFKEEDETGGFRDLSVGFSCFLQLLSQICLTADCDAHQEDVYDK